MDEQNNPMAPPNRSVPPRPRNKRSNRITVTHNVTHQASGKSPVRHLNKPGFTRLVQSDEQPYVRELKVTTEWAKLDTGWVSTVGLVRLDNEATKHPSGSAEQDALQTIQIAFGGSPAITLPPGEWVVFQPVDATHVTLRCVGPQGATVPYTLSIYPR